MNLESFLLRLLIAVLVFWIGEKIISLIRNVDLQQIMTVILTILVVLFAIFGSTLPIK